MLVSESIRTDAPPFAEEIVALHGETRARLAADKTPECARIIDDAPQIAAGKLERRAPRVPSWTGRERRL